MFQPVPARTSPLLREQAVLDLWRANDLFARTQSERQGAEPFVFYEGPPTANGRPHIGHVIPRALKDLFTRFHTMRGKYVPRKAGWDTHGLPVELEVEKALGLSGKPQVEAYGVRAFTERCRESVWQYKGEWERTATERLGYWVDLADPYITYADQYVESVWWAVRQLWEKGLLYHGHKVLPYCPRCGTSLSSHEVAQGYRDVEDPAIYVRFRVTSPGPFEGVSLLAWTTTPWTLPANTALAVRPDDTYALADLRGERVVALKSRLPEGAAILSEFPGGALDGLQYEPPYALIPAHQYRVCTAGWVTNEDGSGVVHVAPAFGEDDFRLGQEHAMPLFCPVDDQGRYTVDMPALQGKFFKDADVWVMDDLATRGLLFRSDRLHHSYPFCWRCDTPLLYMARGAWFFQTTAIKERLVAANQTVNWHPDHFRNGRFGNFLENLIDWCVSRERYWGTPLPIWRCGCGYDHVVGSLEELRQMATHLPGELDLHRPGIDQIELTCPQCAGRMRRVPEVLDCWFDSGCMPFAQYHFPFENRERFFAQFPADFICEAVDQTRGWFYVLLALGVALFDQVPYRNVLVTEFGLDERGKKMSKSRQNVVDLEAVLDQFGADALRFYVYSSGQPWLPKRIAKTAIAEAARVLDTLHNVYAFFVLYANLDGWRPGLEQATPSPLIALDRWLLSRLQGVTAGVRDCLLAYDAVGAARHLSGWVDDLSNWYVRLSRRRFWNGKAEGGPAFATLHHALVQTAVLMGPFTPFLAEALYQNLAEGPSVHLARFPDPDNTLVDEALERDMALVRRYASVGRAARQKAGIKVRQPLAALALVGPEAGGLDGLTALLLAELNVKAVLVAEQLPEGFVAAEEGGLIAAVDVRLTPDLVREGIAREVVNRLQRYRKELGMAVEDRVFLWLDGSAAVVEAVRAHLDYVAGEVQAEVVAVGEPLPDTGRVLEATFEGEHLQAVMTPASNLSCL